MKELKQIDRREQIEDMVDKILQQKSYGDVISHEELEMLTGYDRYDIGYIAVVGGAKELLIEYGYVLKSIINEGYRILYPNEVAEEIIQRYIKASVNKLGKGYRIMQYVDREMLNKEELAFFKSVETLVSKTATYTESVLLEAQAMLNDVKTKELAE